MLKLSTEVVRVDWNSIRKNYLDPAIWGNKYVLYRYGDYEISCELTEIRTKSKTLEFKLVDNESNYSYTHIPMQIDTVDIKVFETILLNKIKYVINSHGEKLAKEFWLAENREVKLNLDKVLRIQFDKLFESINLGDLEDYIDKEDLWSDFRYENNYYIGKEYDYASEYSKNFVSKELELFEGYTKVYDSTIPGAKIELDTEFVEDLELEV